MIVGSAGGQLTVDKSRPGLPRGVSYHVPVWGSLPEMAAVLALAGEGVLSPELTKLSLADARDALDALADGHVSGRFVVTGFDDDVRSRD